MNALRAVSLLAATVSMGLVAGVFGLYAHTIMPGLGGPTTEPSSARSSPSTGGLLAWALVLDAGRRKVGTAG